MVRCYKRKSQRGKKYSQELLQRAIREIRQGILTPNGAFTNYGIPVSTIRDHLKGRRGLKSKSYGRAPAIGLENEQKLAIGLKTLETWGFGLSRSEVFQMVGEFVKRNNLKTCFKNGVPGEDWFLNFKKRHRLSLKKPQNVEYCRKKATDPYIINSYFEMLGKTIDNLDLRDKPDRLWNLDETSFSLDPSKAKIVGAKGKSSSRTTSGPGRDNTTVLAAVNAAGKKALIVYKAKSLWNSWIPTQPIFPGTSYASSKSGWMESQLFYNYFENTLIPAFGPNRPILLIYDGHSTHVTDMVVNLAIQENITILKLPPHTSHLLQPLDLCVFRSLKSSWDKKIIQWQRQNIGLKIPKIEFSRLLEISWLEVHPEIISSGFKKAGIYPYNRSVVPDAVFDPESLRRWKKQVAENNQKSDNAAENIDLVVPSTSTAAYSGLNASDQPFQTSSAGMSSQADASDVTTSVNNNVSFDVLLLETIKQSKQPPKIQRKKIAQHAEILTAEKANQIMTNIEKKGSNRQKRKNIVEESSESEDEGEENVELIDTDDDMDMSVDENEDISDMNHFVLEIGRWVLVRYCGKKILKHYIGQIQKKEEEDKWLIKFARRDGLRFQFKWPQEEDEDIIQSQDIIRILPEMPGEAIFSLLK